MKIQNLKDLKALIKLCRSANISAIEVDGVKLHLGNVEPKSTIAAPTLPDYSSDIPEANIRIPKYNPVPNQGTYVPDPGTIPDDIKTDSLTAEQMLFYSAVESTEEASN
jgi:hypothetical protein